MQTVERFCFNKIRNCLRAPFHENPPEAALEKRRADVRRCNAPIRPAEHDQFIAASGPCALDRRDYDATGAIVGEPALLFLRGPPGVEHHACRTLPVCATHIQPGIVRPHSAGPDKDRVYMGAQPVQMIERAGIINVARLSRNRRDATVQRLP